MLMSYFSWRLPFAQAAVSVKSVLCSVPGSSSSVDVVDRGTGEGLVIFSAITRAHFAFDFHKKCHGGYLKKKHSFGTLKESPKLDKYHFNLIVKHEKNLAFLNCDTYKLRSMMSRFYRENCQKHNTRFLHSQKYFG